jgi:tRNA1Val (adenine37-N6)-methyltransferase
MNKKASGFQCKGFFVGHDKCAMKVSTDSLLFGSWVQPEQAERLLDIGLGSGILALMVMQKAVPKATLDGIELDVDAFQQAKENIEGSPWASRMSAHHMDVCHFVAKDKYDFIISNPPYFSSEARVSNAYSKQSLSSAQARGEKGLTMALFFQQVQALLDDKGRLCCVYPYARYSDVLSTAAHHGFYLNRELVVQSLPDKPPYLVALEFSFQPKNITKMQMTIRETRGGYTQQYRQLCQDYYLNF